MNTATRMHPLTASIATALSYLENRAESLAADFMSTRSEGKRRREEWSDLVIKVGLDGRRLKIEWRTRIWLSRSNGSEGSRRYKSRYVSLRGVIQNAKPHEREEVIELRNRLSDIKAIHNTLLKLERDMTRAGLMRNDADTEAGFIPREEAGQSRSADGRFVLEGIRTEPKMV